MMELCVTLRKLKKDKKVDIHTEYPVAVTQTLGKNHHVIQLSSAHQRGGQYCSVSTNQSSIHSVPWSLQIIFQRKTWPAPGFSAEQLPTPASWEWPGEQERRHLRIIIFGGSGEIKWNLPSTSYILFVDRQHGKVTSTWLWTPKDTNKVSQGQEQASHFSPNKITTQIESSAHFDVPDLKTIGSSIINLDQLNQLPEHKRVTIKVTVLKVNKPETVGGNKVKQDILVADLIRRATLILWENNLNQKSHTH